MTLSRKSSPMLAPPRNASPKPLQQIPIEVCQGLTGILSDIDDTITTNGKLLAGAYDALAQAKESGLMVVIVTGRPAGWVDHLARMWPVDGVIGENGAFYFYMEAGKLKKRYLQTQAVRHHNRKRLDKIGREILRKVSGAALASDQTYRACDLAIDYCEDVLPLNEQAVAEIVSVFKKHHAMAKVSSIHVNGWFGRYDKLHMTKKFLQEVKGINLEKEEKNFVFLGDSPNDEPLFAFFTHGIGVANIKRFLSQFDHPPQWITKKECSQGFSEAIHEILKKRPFT